MRRGSFRIRIDLVNEVYIVNFQTASGANNYRVEVYFTGIVNARLTDWIPQGGKGFATTLPGKK